jgi:hypothetical protein
MTDTELLEWLAKHFFDSQWDGTIGRPPRWGLMGPWRHFVNRMRGNDFREALAAAIESYEREELEPLRKAYGKMDPS